MIAPMWLKRKLLVWLLKDKLVYDVCCGLRGPDVDCPGAAAYKASLTGHIRGVLDSVHGVVSYPTDIDGALDIVRVAHNPMPDTVVPPVGWHYLNHVYTALVALQLLGFKDRKEPSNEIDEW